MKPRLVVLVSGNGSNLQALIDATADGRLDAEIVGVVSNREAAFGVERAEKAHIPTTVVPSRGDDRPTYDRRLVQAVDCFAPELVVLAGFMRILTPTFLDRFDVINLHPALPGMFPGTKAVERAFDSWRAGEIETSGVMVHWVPDEGVDDGPVIASVEVPFQSGDTLETFETRMHHAEHRLLVDAVSQVCADRSFAITPAKPGVGR